MKVPTVGMRNGDFSFEDTDSQVFSKIYDPATSDPVTFQRKAFPGNKIDPSRESPLAKVLYAIAPLPTTADNPLINFNYTAEAIVNATVPNVTFRLDHVFNPNNRVYLRFTDINQARVTLRNSPVNEPATVAGAGLPVGESGLNLVPVTTISASLGFTHVFSPTFFAETVVSQQWFSQFYRGGGNPNLNYEQAMGLV